MLTREEVEKVIAELEKKATIHHERELRTYGVGGTGYVIDQVAKESYEYAVEKLKEVLANAGIDRTKHNLPTEKET